MVQSYGWLPDGTWGTHPQFKREVSGTYFYQNDHLGTPQQLIDSNGKVVWSAKMEAFGKTNVDAGSTVSNSLRFPGQYYDDETGVHYNYFRDYELATGRYLQSDPVGLKGGSHTYAYVNGNPLVKFDALGLWQTGGPEDENASTIVCDGRGNVMIQLDPETNPCAEDCTGKHEKSHKEDVDAASPGICVGKAKGTEIIPTPEEKRATELKAYNLQIDCMKKQITENTKLSCYICEDFFNRNMPQYEDMRNHYK